MFSQPKNNHEKTNGFQNSHHLTKALFTLACEYSRLFPPPSPPGTFCGRCGRETLSCETSLVATSEEIRLYLHSCPHESRYFWKRIFFFFTNRPLFTQASESTQKNLLFRIVFSFFSNRQIWRLKPYISECSITISQHGFVWTRPNKPEAKDKVRSFYAPL